MVKPESLDMYGYFKVLCKWTVSGLWSHAAISQLNYCIASNCFYLEILALFCKSMILRGPVLALLVSWFNCAEGGILDSSYV